MTLPRYLSSRRHSTAPDLTKISTDGLQYVINWDTFSVGSNVFIPCIETAKVIKELRHQAALRTIRVRCKVGIRNNRWGVGVWRTV